MFIKENFVCLAKVEVKGWFPRQSIDLPEKYKKQRPREKKSSPKPATSSPSPRQPQEKIDNLSLSGTPSSPTTESDEQEHRQGNAPHEGINSQTGNQPTKKTKKRCKKTSSHADKFTSDEDVALSHEEEAVEGLSNGPFKLVKRHRKRGKRTPAQT